MRVIVIGLGVQGAKRRAIACAACVATVDPDREEADYRHVGDVPPGSYDAALVCTPDGAKVEILSYLLANKKHVLVEKPLLSGSPGDLEALAKLSGERGVSCYTAYNHRFEPHFRRLGDLLAEGRLGDLYSLRLFYGNGTARLVRDSSWRDSGAGVLFDLGSHLLDTLLYWLGPLEGKFTVFDANAFENRSFDHLVCGVSGRPSIQLEMTLLSWRNHFTADLFAAKGSAHIRSLCKWGPSSFTLRDRKLPSGRPDEQSWTLAQPDPTWQLEYDHFLKLCETGAGNTQNDIWIEKVLTDLSAQAREGKD